MRCCLRRIVRRVDSVGCAVNTGSMLIEPINARRLLERQPVALQAGDALGDAARLRRAGIVQILAAAAHPVHFLGGIDRLKPDRERARQIGRRPGIPPGGAPLERVRRRPTALAPGDGGAPVALHELEECLPALVAQHLADELAERVHILAQPGSLGGN